MVLFRAPSFSLRYQGNGRIEDVHLFMKFLYRFWFYKGLWGSCLASFVDFLNSFVVFLAVLFLTTMLDWSVALRCDEISCVNATLVPGMHSPALFGTGHMFLATILLISSFAAVCYELLGFLETCLLERELESMIRTVVDCGHPTPLHRLLYVWKSMRLRSDGHEEIKLTGDHPFLGNMSWGNFLDTICERIQQDRSFGVVAHREFDSLRAIQALMVYDNYIITLHERGVLETCRLKYADDTLLRLLVRGMFDEFNTLNTGRERVSRVRWQLIKYLALYVSFYPFVVTLYITKTLVKNAAQMRSDWGDYVSRDWNIRARWTFRLYNEVPHILSSRLSMGRQTAVEMVRHLQPYSSWRRFVRRTASAIVLVAAGLSFLNTSLLIAGTIGGVSLVWWISVSVLVFSVFSDRMPLQREYNYNSDLQKLITQIHFSQDEWFISGDTFYNTLNWDFLSSRFYLILADLARNFLMPVILLGILLDDSVTFLVDCIHSESVRVDGLGSVSRGSSFDMQLPDGRSDDSDNDEDSRSYHFGEKCAKSIASFSSVYRSWSVKRMMAAEANEKEQPESPSAGKSALDHFVMELHQRVNEHNSSIKVALPSGSSALTAMSAIPGSLNETLDSHKGWSSSQLGQCTAHEREQMFVSQAWSSSVRDGTQLGREPHRRMLGATREDPEQESAAFHTAISSDKQVDYGNR